MPHRIATFFRNSPYLSKFDGNSFLNLEEQENDINREKMKQEYNKLHKQIEEEPEMLKQ